MQQRHHADAESMHREAAACMAEHLLSAIEERGAASLALSGGGTPRRTFELLAGNAAMTDGHWSRVHVFWCDERCVPPEAPQSNFGMARRHLLDRLPGPGPALHRIHGELDDAEAAAERYEAELRAFFGGPTRFDVCHLGMGPDGHTASLFPGRSLAVRGRLAVAEAEPGMEPFVPRVTLTLEAVNASRAVLFLAGGKRDVLARIEAGADLPAALVRPREEPVWFTC